jgi:hypothetical protein
MALRVRHEGATPNLLKYSILADSEGGEMMLSRADLIRDAARGPLRAYIERAAQVRDSDEACRYLLCNTSMRVSMTFRTLKRFAIDAGTDGSIPFLQIIAEPDAAGIIALEFRHSLSA